MSVEHIETMARLGIFPAKAFIVEYLNMRVEVEAAIAKKKGGKYIAGHIELEMERVLKYYTKTNAYRAARELEALDVIRRVQGRIVLGPKFKEMLGLDVPAG